MVCIVRLLVRKERLKALGVLLYNDLAISCLPLLFGKSNVTDNFPMPRVPNCGVHVRTWSGIDWKSVSVPQKIITLFCQIGVTFDSLATNGI